jgi:hypothetical protein
MRKLAIASLLVVGVALAGSVFAQDTAPKADAAAKPATTAAAPAKHHAKKHAAAAPATDTKAPAKATGATKTDDAAKSDSDN